MVGWHQPSQSGFSPEPRLQAQRRGRGEEQDGAGLLVVVLLYIPRTVPVFFLSRHDDGARERFRRKTQREAVWVRISGSAGERRAGGYGEKHIGGFRGSGDPGSERCSATREMAEAGRRERRLAHSDVNQRSHLGQIQCFPRSLLMYLYQYGLKSA